MQAVFGEGSGLIRSNIFKYVSDTGAKADLIHSWLLLGCIDRRTAAAERAHHTPTLIGGSHFSNKYGPVAYPTKYKYDAEDINVLRMTLNVDDVSPYLKVLEYTPVGVLQHLILLKGLKKRRKVSSSTTSSSNNQP